MSNVAQSSLTPEYLENRSRMLAMLDHHVAHVRAHADVRMFALFPADDTGPSGNEGTALVAIGASTESLITAAGALLGAAEKIIKSKECDCEGCSEMLERVRFATTVLGLCPAEVAQPASALN